MLITLAAVTAIRRSGAAINVPTAMTAASDVTAAVDQAWSRLPQAEPGEQPDPDAGVLEAARQFALQLVIPCLTFPESAEVPRHALQLKRLPFVKESTSGLVENWQIDGAVDSQNDYGVTVRTLWILVLGRIDEQFFPVLATLQGQPVYQMRDYRDFLEEARKTGWQKLQARTAEKKARQLAAEQEMRQANDAAKPADEKAQAALKLAVSLLSAGRTGPARRRLQEVIDQYPGTPAAAEAENLLKPK